MEKLKENYAAKNSSETQVENVVTMNCFVDYRFTIEKKHLPKLNQQTSELFNQWEKNVCLGDFFNTDLYIGIDFWGDLPSLCVTHNPKKYLINIAIEKDELGANGIFFFEPNHKVWYENDENMITDYKSELYRVDFVISKLFTEIHFQAAITKEK